MNRIFLLFTLLTSCFIIIPLFPTCGQQPEPDSKSAKIFRFQLNYGLSTLTANTDNEEEALFSEGVPQEIASDYYNSLKSGYHLDGIVDFHMGKILSLGIEYKFFETRSSVYTTFDPYDGVHLYYGEMSEKVLVNYAGVSLIANNIFKGRKIRVNTGISTGMSYFWDENIVLFSPYLITGKSWAFNPMAGIEIPILDNLSVGLTNSFFLSKLKKLSVDDGQDTQSIDLTKKYYKKISRYDLSIGIILNL